MPSAVKKTSLLSRLGNEQGQTVIEYTLIIVVTVAIVLALTNVIFKPFGDFVSNYMGKYTACLLEYGELPSLGSQDPSPLEEDSECDKKFQGGTLTGGRPPRSDGGTTTKTEGKKTTTTRSDSGTKSGGTNAGSASRSGGGSSPFNRRPSSGVESSGRRGGKTIEIALENGGAGGFFGGATNQRFAIQGKKSSYVAITGLTEAEKKELEKKAEGTAGRLAAGEATRQEKKKMPFKPPAPKPLIEEDKPLTIGNFIRYLFIAALVIALVIFIGGQAVQMSKSGEK